MSNLTEFKKDVDLYIHLRELQLDAQEDDEMGLAADIGRNMRQLAGKHNQQAFYKAVEEVVA